AADAMRQDATAGRASITSLESTLTAEAQTNAGTAAILPRLLPIVDSYSASFDREVAMAAEMDAMAAALRDPRSFAAVEPDFDAHMTKFGDMDNQRLIDVNRRAAMFQQTQQN